jgi:hypothetical protein
MRPIAVAFVAIGLGQHAALTLSLCNGARGKMRRRMQRAQLLLDLDEGPHVDDVGDRVTCVRGVFAGHLRQIAGDLPGAHLNYGPNFPDLFRRAAETVDKILRGAKPADIPVEQPTKFDLVINLTTAKALGLAIPHNVLVLADEVIE